MSRRTAKTDKTPARPSAPREAGSPNLDRHARKCHVCRHPKRRAIEAAFLHWRSPDIIADRYDLSDRKSVYRHAHATGLWVRRKRKVCFVLEGLLERAGEATITASAIVSAVRAYTLINDAGEWVEPPARIGIETEGSEAEEHFDSNRDTQELENEPTH